DCLRSHEIQEIHEILRNDEIQEIREIQEIQKTEATQDGCDSDLTWPSGRAWPECLTDRNGRTPGKSGALSFHEAPDTAARGYSCDVPLWRGGEGEVVTRGSKVALGACVKSRHLRGPPP